MPKIYEYIISLESNIEIFQETCKQIEEHVQGCRKNRQSIDVDGSVVQSYLLGTKRIVVVNDCDMINEVYVDSEVSLDELFGKPKRMYER